MLHRAAGDATAEEAAEVEDLGWTEAGVEAILVNPVYAASIAPGLCGGHEPLVDRATWVRANARRIAEIGAEAWLEKLLTTLETGWPVTREGSPGPVPEDGLAAMGYAFTVGRAGDGWEAIAWQVVGADPVRGTDERSAVLTAPGATPAAAFAALYGALVLDPEEEPAAPEDDPVPELVEQFEVEMEEGEWTAYALRIGESDDPEIVAWDNAATATGRTPWAAFRSANEAAARATDRPSASVQEVEAREPPGITDPAQVDHPRLREVALAAVHVAKLEEAVELLDDWLLAEDDQYGVGDPDGAAAPSGGADETPLELAHSVLVAAYEAADAELEERLVGWLAEDPEHWPIFRLVVLDPWQERPGKWRDDVPRWVRALGTNTALAHYRYDPYGRRRTLDLGDTTDQ
jgi:hypothetical protein